MKIALLFLLTVKETSESYENKNLSQNWMSPLFLHEKVLSLIRKCTRRG